MWQISGPPVTVALWLGTVSIYLIPVLIFNQFQLKIQIEGGISFLKQTHQLIILGPKLLAVMAKWGSANRLTMVQWSNFIFSAIYIQNPN